jgi:transcriptional regulator CBF1
LATIVPDCEKNKGSILQRAVSYINELRAQVADNGHKKVMEKAVLETAVHELTAVNGSLQEQLRNQSEENDRLRKKLKDLGVDEDTN